MEVVAVAPQLRLVLVVLDIVLVVLELVRAVLAALVVAGMAVLDAVDA